MRIGDVYMQYDKLYLYVEGSNGGGSMGIKWMDDNTSPVSTFCLTNATFYNTSGDDVTPLFNLVDLAKEAQ